jgi:hypothetical protein
MLIQIRAKLSPTKSTQYPPTFITSQRRFLFFWRKHGSIKRMDSYNLMLTALLLLYFSFSYKSWRGW